MKTTILFLALLTLHFNFACEEKIELADKAPSESCDKHAE